MTGRLHRLRPGKTPVRIYDYVDRAVPMLWTGKQVYNVGQGMLAEAWNLRTIGLGNTWEVVKASGNLTYWFVVHGTNPFDLISDPKGWAMGGHRRVGIL